MRWVLIFLVGTFSFLAQAELYLTVTGANVRKAKIAVGKVHPLSEVAGPDASFARKILNQVDSDLELAGIFDFLPSAVVDPLDSPKELFTIPYESFSKLQASFVLKLGYKIVGDKLTLEAIFFDVPGQKKIFGNKYIYPIPQMPRAVHSMTEDILRAVTGEKGLFASRILMVCRDLKRRKSPPKDIYVADPDGRNFTRLTDDETLSLSPSWSPDGRSILYTQYEWKRVKGRRLKGTVLKKHDLSNGKRVILSSKDGMNSGAAWSPDGKKIAMTLSFSGRPEIYFVRPDNPDEPEPVSRNILWRKIGSTGFQSSSVQLLFDVEPSWSPDSKKLVISSARSGHPMIYTVDLDSKTANQLTFAGTYNASPAWSPKGDKIVFAAQRLAEGNFDLYIIDIDGGNLKRLTMGESMGRRHANSENPSWAPTGRHLAFASNESGNYAIYVMTNDGAVKRRISPKDKDCSTPSWGPYEGPN